MTYHWQEAQLTPEQVRRVEIFNRRLADLEYTTFLEKQGIGPVCWLFYHFYEEYSSDKRNPPLEDMARVGMIWLDIITTDQVALYEEE